MNRLVAFFAFLICLIACTLLGHYLWQSGDGPAQQRRQIAALLPPGMKAEVHYGTVQLTGVVDDPALLDGLAAKVNAVAGVRAGSLEAKARPALSMTTAPGKVLLTGRVRDAADIHTLQSQKTPAGVVLDISGVKTDARTLPLSEAGPLPAATALAGLRAAALEFTAPAAGQPAKLTGALPEAGWPEFAAALEKDITREKAQALLAGVPRSAATVLPATLPPPATLARAVTLAHQLQGGGLSLSSDGTVQVKGVAAPEVFTSLQALRIPGLKSADLRKLPVPLEGELDTASNTLRLHGTVATTTERQAVLERLKSLRPDLAIIADGLQVEPALMPIGTSLATAEPGQAGPFAALPMLKTRPPAVTGRLEEDTLILEGEMADEEERAALLARLRVLRPDLQLRAEGLKAAGGIESADALIAAAEPAKPGLLEKLPDLRRGVEIRFAGPGAMVQPSLKGFVPPDLAQKLIGAAQRGAGVAPAEALETLHISPLATTDAAAGGWPIPTPAALEQLILRTSAIEAGGFEVDARGLHIHGSATDEQVAALVAIDVKPVKKVIWGIKVPDGAPAPGAPAPGPDAIDPGPR